MVRRRWSGWCSFYTELRITVGMGLGLSGAPRRLVPEEGVRETLRALFDFAINEIRN